MATDYSQWPSSHVVGLLNGVKQAISACATASYLCPHVAVLKDLKDFANGVRLDSHRVQGAPCVGKGTRRTAARG